MLKQRLLTAAILIPVFLAALFLMDELEFAIFLAVILILSLNEWANLSGIQSIAMKLAYITAGVVIAAIVQYSGLVGQAMFILVFALWLIVVLRMIQFGKQVHDAKATAGNGPMAWLDGYFVLLPTVLGLQVLKADDIFIFWMAI